VKIDKKIIMKYFLIMDMPVKMTFFYHRKTSIHAQ